MVDVRLFKGRSWALALMLGTGCSSDGAAGAGTDADSGSSGAPAASSSGSDSVDPSVSSTSAAGTSSSTGAESADATSGSSSTGLVFPDPCDTFAQDCPTGHKCNPFANDRGNSWNDTMCVPVDAQPDGYGEPCTVLDSGVSGFDSCDVGAMCLVSGADTLQGECVELCGGSPDEPTCEQDNAFCRISAAGVLNPCLISCDPLGDECDPEETCVSSNRGPFSCAPAGDGQYAEACMFLNDCAPGLGCFTPPPSVCDPDADGCCLPYCDLQAADCPDTLACVPFFGEGAPAGYEDLGVCHEPE